jgi:hypothetical protein
MVPGVLSLGVKRPGREADHSSPSSSEIKEWVELYLHSSNTPPWRGGQLKHRDNFTFHCGSEEAENFGSSQEEVGIKRGQFDKQWSIDQNQEAENARPLLQNASNNMVPWQSPAISAQFTAIHRVVKQVGRAIKINWGHQVVFCWTLWRFFGCEEKPEADTLTN